MDRETKQKIQEWFKNNFHVHSDWTGDGVEYENHCSNVNDLIHKFFRDIEND